MPLIQTPSIASVVEDQTPQLGGSLDCQDYQLQNAGLVGWYDASIPYTSSVQFGTTLYFQPTTGNGAYLFRGSTSTRFHRFAVQSASVVESTGSLITSSVREGDNPSHVFQWKAGDGSNVNMELDTSSLKPGASNLTDLGTTSARWATTYTDGIATNVETFTAASDTLDEKNNVCLCDCTSNAITLALPVPGAGLQFHIKKIDATANTVSIEPDDPGPELIDGSLTAVISTQYNSITVVSDGSNWFII